MITARERLIRMPAMICGRAAGRTMRRTRSCRGMPYERAVSISVGSMPRTPSIVFSSTGKMQTNAMNSTFWRLPIECSEHDRDRQQRRRRHRAPVLDVGHREHAGPARKAERNAEHDPDDDRDHEAEQRSARGSARRASSNCEKSHISRNSTRIVDSRGNYSGRARAPSRLPARRRIATGTAISGADLRAPRRPRSRAASRPLRGMPAQRPPLDRREDDVDRDAEEPGRERERVELRR